MCFTVKWHQMMLTHTITLDIFYITISLTFSQNVQNKDGYCILLITLRHKLHGFGHTTPVFDQAFSSGSSPSK
jgi:hypothetical protein